MEHIDIEKKIHAIRDTLTQELKQSNAIDSNGHATNEKLFDFIIDEKIKEIQELEPMVANEMGVAKDRYSSNIFNHHIQLLNEMKKNKSIVYEPDLPEQDPAIEKATQLSKKQIFKNGIRNLFQKFTRRNKSKEYS